MNAKNLALTLGCGSGANGAPETPERLAEGVRGHGEQRRSRVAALDLVGLVSHRHLAVERDQAVLHRRRHIVEHRETRVTQYLLRNILHNLEIFADSMVYALALTLLLVHGSAAKADEWFAQSLPCLERVTIEK